MSASNHKGDVQPDRPTSIRPQVDLLSDIPKPQRRGTGSSAVSSLRALWGWEAAGSHSTGGLAQRIRLAL